MLLRSVRSFWQDFDDLISGHADSLAFERQVEVITGLFSAFYAYDAKTFSKYDADYFTQFNAGSEEEKLMMMMTLMEDIMSVQLNRMVWFTISMRYGRYYISMYYDNGYNKASGEDL